MPKDSDPYRKNDDIASQLQMIVMPPPRVEEVLISDEEQVENDPRSYEARLNEKLRGLDLYEDGMTIQQKEELIAVVVASWETAEKEKNRRQFYEEYMHAAEALCNDEEIEFSFPESAENSNETSSLLPSVAACLDMSLSVDVSANVPGFQNNCGASGSQTNKNLIVQTTVTDVASDSSYEPCENDAGCSKTFDQEFPLRDSKSKGRRRLRTKKLRSGSFKALGHPLEDIKEFSKSTGSTNKYINTCTLEQSISVWKPCSSPKETPLISSKRPWCNEEAKPFVCTESDYAEKIVQLVREFDIAQNESKKSWSPNTYLSKPFHLSRRVHFAKKSAKVDKYDLAVGCIETPENDQPLTDTDPAAKSLIKNEPFSRTSGGAFRYVKSNRSHRPTLSAADLEVRTTRSGLRYDVQSSQMVLNESAEVSFRTMNSGGVKPEEASSSQRSDSPSALFGEVEVILDEKLPHFNHLRPDLCNDVSSVMVNDHSEKMRGAASTSTSSSRAGTSKTKNHHSSVTYEKHNHLVNSCIDSDSSDCSSVIDVETIVDDEIEDFVLKRKMLPEYQCLDKESNPTPSKILKKNTS